MIGPGVLSLAWAVAQLGWIVGPSVMVVLSLAAYYTCTLLASCSNTGKRNCTYMDVVRDYLGGFQVKLCVAVHYLNLFGTAIGYTIGSSISMMALERSYCFHSKGHDSSCKVSSNPFMIGFGVVQVFLSQIPNFDRIWWLSFVAALMSFTYPTIGLGLEIAKFAENEKFRGSLTGVRVGIVTETQKIWTSFQAIGAIAFAFSYTLNLIEIQDRIKSPPSEYKEVKKSAFISIAATSVFKMLCGFFGYAAFGDTSPGNLLTGFGFYNPYWLVNIANAAVVIHLVGAYQVFCQPMFVSIEETAQEWFPDNKFIIMEVAVQIPGFRPYKLNMFRLVWRTVFVIITTIISILMPFFNNVIGILGAIKFWPLTIYLPVEIYISQNKIPKWSSKWIGLQILSAACLIVSIAAIVGSFAGVFS
ncbi:amino acid permease 2 [Perilla frutescens var. frutescens]|nr:amino acid permease 2 [Perilla frutescens var. frutescens]